MDPVGRSSGLALWTDSSVSIQLLGKSIYFFDLVVNSSSGSVL